MEEVKVPVCTSLGVLTVWFLMSPIWLFVGPKCDTHLHLLAIV